MIHLKLSITILFFSFLQSCQKNPSIALAEQNPFTGVAQYFFYVPGFDSYFLYQRLSTEPRDSQHTFKIRDGKIEFIDNLDFFKHNDQARSSSIEGEGFESAEGKLIEDSETYTLAYTSFQNKHYTLSNQFVTFQTKDSDKKDTQSRLIRSCIDYNSMRYSLRSIDTQAHAR